ncbi:hypothetical protein BDN72DRAFT_831383 [Pluteus cervinus]|uniref:Uncharacterized protein n=1 Tax=Pluteus cervinus TaxID=181527 RepID=A0ACD3BDR9_9AGAR|nr:hypothetical protein BDN72DRAFT_831383 [Pluteus cervinus]
MASNPLHEALQQMEQFMAEAGGTAGTLTPTQIDELLSLLPHLTEKQVEKLGHKDSMCSICYNSFSSLLAEEEMALAMDSPAHPIEELGVTILDKPWQCSHIFCRKDIRKWVKDGNNSCPVCRRNLLQLPEDASDTSSNRQEDDRALLERLFFQQFSSVPGGPALQGGLPADFAGIIGHNPQPAQRDDDDSHGYSAMYS